MKTCAGCGGDLPEKQQKWCSKECRDANYKRKTETGICEECGKSYEYALYRKGRTRFCSRKCVGASSARTANAPRIAKRIELICANCNKTYKKPPYQAKRSKFCSRSCKGSYQCKDQDGESNFNYKNGIRGYRDRAYAVHKAECKLCGAKERLHIHHIDGDRTHNEVDNLIPLCEPCHFKTHTLAKRGAKLMNFLDSLPDKDTYYAYILPLMRGIAKKNHLINKIKCICEYCGIEYFEKISRIERTRFCSRKCQGRFQLHKK